MVVRRGVATVILAWALFSPTLARAQAFSASPAITAGAGYSANAILYHDPWKNPAFRFGPFVSVTPSLFMLYETPTSTQALQSSVALAALIPFATITVPKGSEAAFSDEKLTYNVRLAYTNRIELSELTLLNLSLAGSAVPLNSTVGAVDVSSVPLEETSSTFSYNLSLNGQESITRQLAPESHLVQLANVTYSYPFNATPARATTLNIRNSLAAMHEWARDTGFLTLTVAYTHFGPSEQNLTQLPGGRIVQLRDEFLNSLVATWKRPLTPTLASSVDLGVLQAVSPQATGQVWQPVGGASLTYDLGIATASLSYTHTAQPNVLTGTVNIDDQVALRGGLPFGESGVSLGGAVGYTHATPITFDFPATSTDTIVADVDLVYTPPSIPKLFLSLRGSYNRQTPEDNPLAGFTRMALIANVAFSFPNAQSAAIQRRIAPAYTPTPVLGSDTTPAPGVQPKPVELEEPEAPLPTATTPKKP